MPEALLKRTPLFNEHLQLGAKMVPFAGWEMPVFYPDGIISEHNAARHGAGLFDIGHMGLLEVEGPQALPFLQSVTTNDVAALPVNRSQYSFLCHENGGVIDDIIVCRLPEKYLLVVNAVNTDKVLAWLAQIAKDVSFSLVQDSCMIALQGPAAEGLAAKALNLPLSSLPRRGLLQAGAVLLSRTGYTGMDGFEFIVKKNNAVNLWRTLIQAGAVPCGLGARDTLRLEAGLPLYGHEYDEETTPLEANYGWAVKFNKGNFIGRSALLKEKEEGLKKKLVGLTLNGRAIPRQGNPVFSATQKRLGVVTSGTFSPFFKKPIALAYLSSDEKEVLVDIRSEKIAAAVVDKSFYKRVE